MAYEQYDTKVAAPDADSLKIALNLLYTHTQEIESESNSEFQDIKAAIEATQYFKDNLKPHLNRKQPAARA